MFGEFKTGMTTPEMIIVFFIIQQIFIWLRIFVKVWFAASQFEYHKNYFIPDIEEAFPVLTDEKEEWDFSVLNEKPE